MKNIYTVIRTIRKEKGLNQNQVAEHLGMEQASYSKIERGDVSINIERLYQIAELFKMEAADLLTYGKGAVKKIAGNITYVPVKAQAGYLTELLDNVNNEDCITFNLPFFRESNLFMLDVEGDSMNPTVNHGDYAIVRKENETSNIKFGIPYVIESTDGRVMKRIHSHVNEAKFMLKSDNEVYEPYSIDKETILSIWEIKGFMSKDLSPRNIYHKRLQVLEENMMKYISGGGK